VAVAVVASAMTVVGVLVPLLAAVVALAAAPLPVTIKPGER
jgi:hypothetical protein